MIILRTGVPGGGKTLSMVEALAKLVGRWERHPEEARPIFVLGIPDLALPHSEVPLISVQINKAGSPSLVPDWDAMPDGSLVLIDESQGVFPPRSSASTAPAHVAWLNTHRHRGFDIWLTTQHPKLIDYSVRALVGKHQHYRRLFGGSRAVVYEWDACSDNLSGIKSAVTSYWPYPKKVFKWYKSAEIHTKQTFKMPAWLMIPVVGVLLGVFFLPRAYAVLSSGASGRGVSAPKDVPVTVTQKKAAVVAAPLAVSGVPAAAPDFAAPYHDGQKVVPDRPVSALKLAHGVYGDDPKQAAHLSEEERGLQARNAAILERQQRDLVESATLLALEAERRASVRYVPPSEIAQIPAVFH